MLALRSVMITTALATLIGCQQPAPALVGCELAVSAIHAIQGSDASSPLLERQVTVRGIVTASWQADEQLGGFYLHSLAQDSDNNPLTSEGLFVRTDENAKGFYVSEKTRIKQNFINITVSKSIIIHCFIRNIL